MKNKALISHCHVWEGHTLPKHGPDHSWTAFGCWARMIAFMCPTIRSEHKPWRTLMKAVDCLNAEGWTEVFPGQQADKHYSHDWWINFWCSVQTLVLKFRGFFFHFFHLFFQILFCFCFIGVGQNFQWSFSAPLAISSRFFNSVEPQRRQQRNLQTVTWVQGTSCLEELQISNMII